MCILSFCSVWTRWGSKAEQRACKRAEAQVHRSTIGVHSHLEGGGRGEGCVRNGLTTPLPLSECGSSDDFHSAMHQANSAIRALLHLSRQHSYSHTNGSIPSPSTSPSTSTLPNPATATDTELSRARIEAMNKLVGILQRNLRVRYELEVGEVVRA